MAVDLGRQIGPLPLGAWIAVVGGGLGIAWYTKRQSSNQEPEVTDDTTGPEGVGTGPGWTAVPPPTTAPTTGSGKPTTNEEWGQRAAEVLIMMGYSAVLVDSMVRKALTGTQMSASESALYAIALGIVGSMPSALPPAPTPTPPPLITPTPVSYKPPAVRKSQYGSTARPNMSRWVDVFRYYYSHLPPKDSWYEKAQVAQLWQYNGSTSMHKGRLVKLPSRIYATSEPRK